MSNLLDKASIILTPTAYDNGKALCVKPSDGSGDFDFSRNSAATRVNAQGLVENVQILSSNLVQNGDFSEEGVQEVSNGSFSQEGVELVTNGSFDTDSDWTKGTGWSIGDGKAISDGTSSNLDQSNTFLSGKTYKVVYTIEDYVSGDTRFRFTGTSNENGTLRSANGIYTEYITLTNNQSILRFVGSGILSITNISVKEVGQDWTLGTGWSIGEDKAVYSDGAKFSQLKQTLTNNNTSYYKVTFDAVINSGQFRVKFGSNNYDIITTTDTYTIYGIFSASNTNITFEDYDDISSDFSITNISVKEVGQNWTLGTGWSIGDDKLTFESNDIIGNPTTYSNAFILATPFVVGKKYRVTLTDLEILGGAVEFKFGREYNTNPARPILTSADNGTYVDEFVAVSTADRFTINNGSARTCGSIGSVSAIEITDDTSLPRISYENFSYQDALGSEEIVNGTFSSDTAWNKGTGWSISGGSANGLATLDPIYQLISGFTAGKKYKVSFEITEVTNGFIRVYGYVGASGTFTKVLETPSQIGTYEVIFEFGGTNKNLMFYGSAGGGNFTGSIDNVSVKEYLGQEVVPDSGCGSWLWESQSTNLITQSELFSDASWVKLGAGTGSAAIVTSDYAISPDGTQNASRLQCALNGGGGSVSNQSLIYDLYTSSGNQSLSIYVKSNTGLNQTIYFSNTQTSGDTITVTNEWQRFEFNHITATYVFAIGLRGRSGGAIDDTADILIWGAQVEQQTYSTSYIPTSGSSVTRNQDLCTNGGSLASINSTEGVLYAEIAALVDDNTNRQISINNGTTNDRIQLYFDTSSNRVSVFYKSQSGATQFILNHTLSDIKQFNKLAFKWKQNDFALWSNGLEVATQTSGVTSIANTLTNLDFQQFNSAADFFGKTKALAVWKEALTDAELTELTTI